MTNCNQTKCRGRTVKKYPPTFSGRSCFIILAVFPSLPPSLIQIRKFHATFCDLLCYQQMFDRLATFANKACERGISTQSETDSVTYLISVLVHTCHNFTANHLISELTLPANVCCAKLFDR